MSERRATRKSIAVNYAESPVESPTTRSKTISVHIETPSIKTPKNSRGRKSTTAKIDLDESSEEIIRPRRKSMKNLINISDSEDVLEYQVKPRSKSARKASVEPENVSPIKKRRSIRAKTPSGKGLESIASENSPIEPRKSIRKRRQTISNPMEMCYAKFLSPPAHERREDKEGLNSSNEENFDANIQKPMTLFDDAEDVEGKSMIQFKTPKKRHSMAVLAQQTPKTPHHDKGTPKRLSEAPKTPTSRPAAYELIKTPKHIRDQIKLKLVRVNQKINYESDGDFSSGSENDYRPEEESSSSDQDSDQDEDEMEEEQPRKPMTVSARVLKTPATTRSLRSQKDFVLRSDDYFSAVSSKSKTSDNTMDRLKNALPHDQLIKLLANMELTKEHKKVVKSLNGEHKQNFDKWLFYLHEGFTVLLHGLGSKRNLLQAFHEERLANEHVIVINGFFPSLTVKDVLESIMELLEMSATGNPHEIVNAIEKEMKEMPELKLFLIVHNIDGSMLRNDRAQSVMSQLAKIKNLNLIASIDHINAPLMWNNTKLSNYNFVWFDATTFLPYTEETSYENSFLVQNSGALELSSMKSVFQSLTTNARKIYILLVKNQLKNGGNSNYQGISFKELYSASREEFLVSSDVALRAQLTEYLDHKLAKLKRNDEGIEYITIPLKNSLLEQFLNEQS